MLNAEQIIGGGGGERAAVIRKVRSRRASILPLCSLAIRNLRFLNMAANNNL